MRLILCHFHHSLLTLACNYDTRSVHIISPSSSTVRSHVSSALLSALSVRPDLVSAVVIAAPALCTVLYSKEAIVASLAQPVALWHTDSSMEDTMGQISFAFVQVAAEVLHSRR